VKYEIRNVKYELMEHEMEKRYMGYGAKSKVKNLQIIENEGITYKFF
jgi:hypothetical protein